MFKDFGQEEHTNRLCLKEPAQGRISGGARWQGAQVLGRLEAMAVITVSREAGSGGTQIAEDVANALGYHFADRSTAIAVMQKYGFSKFEDEYDSQSGFRLDLVLRGLERSEQKAMVDTLPQVSLALAHHGNVVILGRGSFAVLGGRIDVLNVRIQAPFSTRVKWFMERQNMTMSEAEVLVRERDGVRAAFVQSWYGVRVDETSLFDLVIDTEKVPREMATRWLVEMARHLELRKGDDGRMTDTIQVDPVLASTISEQLKCEAAHR
jgi:cytidylate kinase